MPSLFSVHHNCSFFWSNKCMRQDNPGPFCCVSVLLTRAWCGYRRTAGRRTSPSRSDRRRPRPPRRAARAAARPRVLVPLVCKLYHINSAAELMTPWPWCTSERLWIGVNTIILLRWRLLKKFVLYCYGSTASIIFLTRLLEGPRLVFLARLPPAILNIITSVFVNASLPLL